tara:strand:+ start:470 stop:856 length:387 start_codon:yes stop_codon:yes gene_type:complete
MDTFSLMSNEEFWFQLTAFGITPNTVSFFLNEEIDQTVFHMLITEEDQWLRDELGPDSHDYHQLQAVWQSVQPDPEWFLPPPVPPNTPNVNNMPQGLRPPELRRGIAEQFFDTTEIVRNLNADFLALR